MDTPLGFAVQPPAAAKLPACLELDLPEITEWLPEHEVLSPKENDAWIEREQALRYKPGQDRGCPFPSSGPFDLL